MRIGTTVALTIALAFAGGCTKQGSQGSGGGTATTGGKTSGGAADAKGGKVVELQTSMGNIQIELDREKAPKTVANFLDYVRSGHYNGTIFHRVISSFMIQGGGFGTDMQKKSTRDPIQNEADNGLSNVRGTIAMARTPNPHSASAQFFINVKDNDNLDHKGKTRTGWGYCVFGKVIKGMDVVDKIKDTPTKNKGGAFANAPVTPVVINAAKVVR